MHGIELCPEYYNSLADSDLVALAATSPIPDAVRIRLWKGTSPDCLAEMLPKLYGRDVTVWCDAHYDGKPAELCGKYGQCPLIAELDTIVAAGLDPTPLIMIDDASVFASTAWWRKYGPRDYDRDQWPTFTLIYDTLKPHGYRILIDQEIIWCWRP